jgi:hypothetical protein
MNRQNSQEGNQKNPSRVTSLALVQAEKDPYAESMRKARQLLLLLVFICTPVLAAELSILGGLNYAAPTDIRSGLDQRPTGSAAPVFGLGIDLPFSELPFSFESGFFLKSSLSESPLTAPTVNKGEWTDIPLLVHYHFDPSVSLGLGGYWSFFRSGDAIQKTESPDSGILLDLRARIRISDSFFFLVDGRYLHGLSNLSAIPGDTYNTRSIQFLAGASYLLF